MTTPALASAHPQEISIDEARKRVFPAVDRLVSYMKQQSFVMCPFRLSADGHHDDGTAILVALHCERFLSHGCEIVSHAFTYCEEEGVNGGKVPKTHVSLLVRAPKVVS